MRWLGKGGLGLIGGGLVKEGQSIPKDGLTSERILELHRKGLVDLEGAILGKQPAKKGKRKKNG